MYIFMGSKNRNLHSIAWAGNHGLVRAPMGYPQDTTVSWTLFDTGNGRVNVLDHS